jgi:hypothetical protein
MGVFCLFLSIFWGYFVDYIAGRRLNHPHEKQKICPNQYSRPLPRKSDFGN